MPQQPAVPRKALSGLTLLGSVSSARDALQILSLMLQLWRHWPQKLVAWPVENSAAGIEAKKLVVSEGVWRQKFEPSGLL
jgi:hypothetical protein